MSAARIAHTPEDWRFLEETVSLRPEVRTADSRQVAQIFGYDKFQRRQRGVLIAAAPDLLEEHRELWMAATQALAQLEKYDSGTADAIRQEFKRGLKRAAIAKATGDQS